VQRVAAEAQRVEAEEEAAAETHRVFDADVGALVQRILLCQTHVRSYVDNYNYGGALDTHTIQVERNKQRDLTLEMDDILLRVREIVGLILADVTLNATHEKYVRMQSTTVTAITQSRNLLRPIKKDTNNCEQLIPVKRASSAVVAAHQQFKACAAECAQFYSAREWFPTAISTPEAMQALHRLNETHRIVENLYQVFRITFNHAIGLIEGEGVCRDTAQRIRNTTKLVMDAERRYLGNIRRHIHDNT
jgi:hypothetical protein